MTEYDYPPINCYCDEDYECHICVGRGLERARIVAWLRTAAVHRHVDGCGSCIDGEPCMDECVGVHYLVRRAADALERGEHE